MLIAPSRATHSQRLLQMLLDDGHSVTFIDYQNPQPESADRYTFIELSKHPLPRWVRTNYLRIVWKNWTVALNLRRVWKKIQPDVVHVVDIEKRAYRCALARIHPLILTSFGSDINDLFEKDDQGSRQWKEVARALQTADHITADSYQVLERCEFIAGRFLNKSLFYFGIDLELFKPRNVGETQALRSKLGIPSGAKVILSARRFIPKMRQDIVLRAFAEILKCNLKVVLVYRRFGVLVEYEDELRVLAKQLGIANQIIWVDEMDYEQIPLLYNLANVIVNVPEQDGLPVTLFEASACMKPVITTDLPAYQEFLSAGEYIRVPVGDVAKLAEAIKLVLADNKSLIEQLGKNYELVLKTANQKKCLSGLNLIYSQAIG